MSTKFRCLIVTMIATSLFAGDDDHVAKVPGAGIDPQAAMLKFKIAEGLKCSLYAASPDVCNIVSFSFDEKGRCFVCETYRRGEHGVLDIRGFRAKTDLIDMDLASKTVEDRAALMKIVCGNDLPKMSVVSERVRLLEDRHGTGKADYSSIFADGFNTLLDGTAAGILARKGTVWFADIPNLWLLKDTTGAGKADVKKSLHYGYGIRISFRGHDLHGIKMGPDGKIYYSIGDRAANVTTEGKNLKLIDCGGVFRCNPDGSDLEIFATGLRNPQCLTFDQYGNLFTGDNNSDSGDKSRWVYVVEGGDSGWRYGYQIMEHPSRGPFNSEKIWHLQNDEQPAYIVPPCANISSGPAGCTYYPGTGLPDRYNEHFFLVDFTGGARAGVFSFGLKPRGATFELTDIGHIVQEVLATHVDFAPDGGLYVSDWVEGWDAKGQGRIYKLFDPEKAQSELTLNVKKLLNEGMEKRPESELATLLAHPDLRVRQEAQFELADRGAKSIDTFALVAAQNANPLARLHAIWGLGQIDRTRPLAVVALLPSLSDNDAEVRAQAARVLGDRHAEFARDSLVKLLADASPRVRFFAACSLGKLARKEAVAPVLAMLRENADKDAYLRHAGVMALLGINDMDALNAAAKDDSAAVRMAVLLTYRRMEKNEVAQFLNDKEPALVLEAARAINDLPLTAVMPKLAALLDQPTVSEPLLRRTINANYRTGTAEAAARLAKFAATESALPSMRIEAVNALRDWPKPSGRDRVTGIWRPIPAEAGPRDNQAALNALAPVLQAIMHGAPTDLKVATAQAAGRLDVPGAGPLFFELISTANGVPADLKIEALKALAEHKDSQLGKAVDICVKDKNKALQRAALGFLAGLDPAAAVDKLTQALETGDPGEKQFALTKLGPLPLPAADGIISKWMDKLLADTVPKEIKLDLTEAAGQRSAPEIKAKLKKYEAMRSKTDPLAPYLDALYGGDASAGHQIFFERQEVACLRCHTVAGTGGDVGPNLSGIGKREKREYLLESIMFPNKVIAKGFESVMVKMKDGKVYAGTLKSETESDLVLNTVTEGTVTLKKDEIKARKLGLSSMPEDTGQKLTLHELRDVVEFLAGQRK